MAPRKKKSTMIWVRKSQQPEKMAKPETEKMTSALDCSSLLEELPYSSNMVSKSLPSSSTKMAEATTKDHTLSKQDWSLLPEELLHIISEKLENCFDVIHARSVCHAWRSIFPFPSSLLRTSYSLPSFSTSSSRRRRKGMCTLEKFPMFFFRVRAPAVVDGLPSEFFVGGINRDKSEDDMKLQSPFQCSVKVNIPGSEPTFLNVLDCQILPLGYQFRMVGWDPNSLRTSFRGVGFLPLDKDGGKEFVVLIGYSHDLWALRSSEMRWMRLDRTSIADCSDIVTFRGKFYVKFLDKAVIVIDPYSLERTPVMPSAPLTSVNYLVPSDRLTSVNYLVPSGNDELFLVEKILDRGSDVLDFSKLACRVSRLDEDAREWVVVTDLGNRILLIGQLGNSSCSAEDLPDGCGVTGNSFLFTYEFLNKGRIYKYGADTGNADDNLNFWRYSLDSLVTILSASPMVAFQVETSKPENLAFDA